SSSGRSGRFASSRAMSTVTPPRAAGVPFASTGVPRVIEGRSTPVGARSAATGVMPPPLSAGHDCVPDHCRGQAVGGGPVGRRGPRGVGESVVLRRREHARGRRRVGTEQTRAGRGRRMVDVAAPVRRRVQPHQPYVLVLGNTGRGTPEYVERIVARLEA